MGYSNDISSSNWSLFKYICLIFISSAWTIFKKTEIAISDLIIPFVDRHPLPSFDIPLKDYSFEKRVDEVKVVKE